MIYLYDCLFLFCFFNSGKKIFSYEKNASISWGKPVKETEFFFFAGKQKPGATIESMVPEKKTKFSKFEKNWQS
jgi:hypothetical protein